MYNVGELNFWYANGKHYISLTTAEDGSGIQIGSYWQDGGIWYTVPPTTHPRIKVICADADDCVEYLLKVNADRGGTK